MFSYGLCWRFVLLGPIALIIGCGDPSPDASTAAKTRRAATSAGETSRGENAEEAASPQEPRPSAAEVTRFVHQMRPKVEAFCADCHVMPRPASSAREDWVEEVEQGYMLYQASGRSDLEVPDQEEVLKYFQLQAPETLLMPESIRGYPPNELPLQPSPVRFPGRRPPGITDVQWIDLGLKDSPALVYCDIGSGAIKAHWPGHPEQPTERLATLLQPVHVEPCDLNADGRTDLLVSDIGEFDANDSDLGRVVWLRRAADSEKFETVVLQDGLSRVADARAADFDGDGDSDVLVAAFGWRNTGRIFLLDNTGFGDGGQPNFRVREIDDRHGAVHVPTVDLNGDGHLDFVALLSQDHEVVEAFLNDGQGNFENHVIWQAPDPAYGSSGIQLVDMDNDHDLDVLYTNGDSFDRGAKPHHSVQWLENRGTYPYTHHHLSEMPGVLSAQAGDFDGDGDVDVVACSLLAAPLSQQLANQDTSSVVMLMQTAKGKFRRTRVETAAHQHIALETGDFDNNGHLDFAVGNFLRADLARPADAGQPDLVLWWNRP